MSKKEQKMKEQYKYQKTFEDQIEGRNAVIELLESGKDINKIFITKGERHGSINKIISMAKERKVVIVEKDKRKMEQMAQNQNYQGVIAIVPPFEYCEIDSNSYRTDESKNDSEIRANRFAASFLMPASSFSNAYRALLKDGFDKEAIIKKLSDDFNVPETAVKIRIEELELNNE